MDAFNDNKVRETKEFVTITNASTTTTTHNNAVPVNDTFNNNTKGVNNSVNNSEIDNKKIVDSNNGTSPSPSPSPNDIINSNLKIKSTSTAAPPRSSTTATTTKPKTTNRIDVTSIVREQPKVMTKPLAVHHVPTTNANNSTDETDRVAVNSGVDIWNANNKLASKINIEQTATSKTISEINNRLESNLPYQEGKFFQFFFYIYIFLFLYNKNYMYVYK